MGPPLRQPNRCTSPRNFASECGPAKEELASQVDKIRVVLAIGSLQPFERSLLLRQIHLAQQRRVPGILPEIPEPGIDFHVHQSAVMLAIGTLEP